VLGGDDLYAAIRYVAGQAPRLAPTLFWAISSAPEHLAVLCARPPASGELAALAALDEALDAVVQASPAGFRLSGKVWQKPGGANGSEEPASPSGPLAVTAGGIADVVRKVARLRPSLVPACLWLIRRQPASRLAVETYLPKPEELAELQALAHAGSESGPGEGEAAVGPFEITEAEAQEVFVHLALKFTELRAKTVRLRQGVDRRWPEAMFEGRTPPTLAFSLFGSADTLIEEYLDRAIETAWSAAQVTEESVRTEWEVRERAWRETTKRWRSEVAVPEES